MRNQRLSAARARVARVALVARASVVALALAAAACDDPVDPATLPMLMVEAPPARSASSIWGSAPMKR